MDLSAVGAFEEAKNSNYSTIFFFDDFVGGGTQASRYLAKPLASIRKNYPLMEIIFIL